MAKTTAGRFWSKVEVTDGCWLWTGCQVQNGYGQFRFDGRTGLAHRWAYEHFVGPIPDGLDLDHLCRVRHCVNPAHLEPVTRAENLHRGKGNGFQLNAAKTHCAQGHPFSGHNLIIGKNGQRLCRACKNAWRSKRRKQLRAEGKKVTW